MKDKKEIIPNLGVVRTKGSKREGQHLGLRPEEPCSSQPRPRMPEVPVKSALRNSTGQRHTNTLNTLLQGAKRHGRPETKRGLQIPIV